MMVVPDDLPGNLRIIIVAFQRWQQLLVSGWTPLLTDLAQKTPGLTVWEVPALSRLYAAGRFYIDGGMRAGIRDAETRRHTLTAYTDLRAFCSALGIARMDTIRIYVVDRDGEVVFEAEGEVDEEKALALVDAVKQANARASRSRA